MDKRKNVVSYVVVMLIAIVMLAGCSETQEKPSVTEGQDLVPASNKGEKLTLSLPESKLEWTGKKVTGQHNGTVEVSKGTVSVDDGMLTGGNFEFDFTTITVLDISNPESNTKLTNHLKSDDFFSAEKFPTGSFEITSVTPVSNGDYNYNIGGNLTIKGITNEIVFPAKVNVSGNTLSATADFKIDRTQWDVKYRSGKFFENLGDKLINDDIELKLKIEAK